MTRENAIKMVRVGAGVFALSLVFTILVVILALVANTFWADVSVFFVWAALVTSISAFSGIMIFWLGLAELPEDDEDE